MCVSTVVTAGLLWIKESGASDAGRRRDQPKAGTWWPGYAGTPGRPAPLTPVGAAPGSQHAPISETQAQPEGWVSFGHDLCVQRPTSVVSLTDDKVVLLDEHGLAIGDQDRVSVHSATTPLHLAFSLYLYDDADQVLFTRRALRKLTWPGVWSNSCCGHPRPGEHIEDALRRRLHEELGLSVADLRCALPDFAYRARDASGIWENEVCPVFVGRVLHPTGEFSPNAEEVMDWNWVEWADVKAAVLSTPFAFSPWAVQQVTELPQHLRDVGDLQPATTVPAAQS
jgi:isopentenyl-diphosphate delta-isomerase